MEKLTSIRICPKCGSPLTFYDTWSRSLYEEFFNVYLACVGCKSEWVLSAAANIFKPARVK